MNKQFFKKLKSRAGETLVETLVAILIATFASILLAGATSTAMELNRQARERDRVNQLCLERLAKEVNVTTAGEEGDKFVKIQPMQMDPDTGKLVVKTNGDTPVIPVSIKVVYVGGNINDEGQPSKLGDFSTYKLYEAPAGS